MKRSAWVDILLLLAAIKLAVGLVGLVIPLPVAAGAVGSVPPTSISVLNTLVFGATAALLVFAGRQDLRAVHLGTFFLLVATSFAHPGIPRLVRTLPPAFGGTVEIVRAVQVDAFLPYVLWLFVRDFPQVPPSIRLKRMLRLGLSVSWIAGIVLFLANLSLAFATEPGSLPHLVLKRFAREGTANDSMYYGVLLTLSAIALVVLMMKAPLARASERRRVRLFCAALVLGWGPVSLEILLESTIPAYYAFSERPTVRLAYSLVIYPCLLALPVGTTYSVLVDHVLGVRLVVRKALRYALARYSVMFLIALPLLCLAWYVYTYRDLTIAEILRSGGPLLFLATSAAVLLLRTRHRLLEAIDRRFFRDQYTAHQALTALVHESQKAGTMLDLTRLVREKIDAALHVDSAALLIRDESGSLVAPDEATLPLSSSSVLAELLAGSVDPLSVDLQEARSPFLRLPEEERQWLGDGGFRLLVPMLDAKGSLVGLIALGEKKSELPFHSEDRSLLSAVATSCAWVLGNRLLRSTDALPSSGSAAHSRRGEHERDAELARECSECGRLYAPPATACEQCAGALRSAAVPLMLAGKFRLEQRIGSGGMGVVYRAVDVTLGRQVAVKTLPRTSPEHATRLRREARVAASVSHPHLAVIYGAETWRGTPMLIFEFLDGGTLADRIRRAPLPPEQVVALGIALASALECAHAAGILHGDIKPSNIGYHGNQQDGTPKLLDFGVARILHGPNRTATSYLDTTTDAITATAAPVGTLAYLSPEALQGESPDTSFDLWSLALVLLEALLGRNPFRGHATLDTVLSIDRAAIVDALATGPACPAPLRTFFEAALARSPSRRPVSATQFRRILEECVVVATL